MTMEAGQDWALATLCGQKLNPMGTWNAWRNRENPQISESHLETLPARGPLSPRPRYDNKGSGSIYLQAAQSKFRWNWVLQWDKCGSKLRARYADMGSDPNGNDCTGLA